MFKNAMKAGEVLKLQHLGIRKQILYLTLACSLITLLVAGSIAVFGMFRIKSSSEDISNQLGEAAASDSSKKIIEVTTTSMQQLSSEHADKIDNFFYGLTWDVNVLAREMTTILSNPQNYSSRRISQPSRDMEGKLTSKIRYKADVNREEIAREVGLTANLQDLQVRLYDEKHFVGSNYVTSQSGFTIITDKVAASLVDANNNPVPVDFTTRPWYLKAVTEKKVIFTDLFEDAQGRGLAVACAAPYYNASGNIAGVVGEGVTLEDISKVVSESKFGETSFAFVVDDVSDKILFSTKENGELSTQDETLFDSKDPRLVEVAKKIQSDEDGVQLLSVDDVNYYVAYNSLKNIDWSFGIAISEDEVTKYAVSNRYDIETITASFVDTLNNSIMIMIFVMLLGFIAIMAASPFASRKIADKFTQPLHVLTEGVREIASGNWDKKIEVDTENEIKHLAVCFNAMTDELKRYTENLTKVTAEKERIATELNVATEIQVSMLPHEFDFGRTDFELYATMNAAKEVGGDFYDFYLLDDSHLVITMADVSGKGVPAALFMVIAKTILKNFALTMSNPDDFAAVMTCANNQLCQNNDAMMFVTVFMGMLDLKTGEFVYVNGGHNPPVIYHSAENKCEYLKVRKNFVLGGMEDMNYIQESIKLQRGDMIYLYTDGVTEALNNEKELYGEERLLNCLNNLDKNLSVAEILKIVRADVNKHVDGAEQSDDITMLAVKYQ